MLEKFVMDRLQCRVADKPQSGSYIRDPVDFGAENYSLFEKQLPPCFLGP